LKKYLQYQFSQSIYHNLSYWFEKEQNKINTDLMDECNNENILYNNSEKKINKDKINKNHNFKNNENNEIQNYK